MNRRFFIKHLSVAIAVGLLPKVPLATESLITSPPVHTVPLYYYLKEDGRLMPWMEYDANGNPKTK